MTNGDKDRKVIFDGDVHTGEGGAALPSTFLVTEPQLRAILQSLANQKGSIAEFARQLDISGQFLGKVISGRKRPGKAILGHLGASVERVYKITAEAADV